MTRGRGFLTATGRGLVWAQRGEALLAVVAALYLVTFNARLAILGFFLTGIPGVLSARRMWVGRQEFGPSHEKAARRGTYLFVVAALLFILAYASSGTFVSATQRFDPAQNETLSTETAHRFKDLLPSLALVSLAIALETVSGAHYLWELVGAGWRRYAAAYAALGAVGGATIFAAGLSWVRSQQAVWGERVETLPTAQYYFREWTDKVLPLVMGTLLMTRLVALVLVRRAMRKVQEAEASPPEEAPTASAPSP